MEQKTEASQAVDERAEFEQAMNDMRSLPRELDFSMTRSPSGRPEYANTHLESCWNGWQARAALKAQPAPTEAPISFQDVQDAARLAWSVALDSAAFYVVGHCGDGDFHAEAILGMPIPVIKFRGEEAPAEAPNKQLFENIEELQPSGNTGELAQGEDSARLDADMLALLIREAGILNERGMVWLLNGESISLNLTNLLAIANMIEDRVSAETGGVKS